VCAAGLARLDSALEVRRQGAAAQQRLRESLDLDVGRAIVMYAPAARGRGRDAQPPLLDIERWAAELGERTYLLVRSHPSERLEISSRWRWAVRDIGEPSVATDFLTASDLLISDYSSMIGDASLLEVPVILFQPDRDTYVNRLHGLYIDLDRLAPVVAAASDLVELVDAWLTDSSIWESRYGELMRAFAADHCGPSDGSSAARGVAALLDTELGR
jgi:CDP-glycerol glycerophosphotransferase